MCTILCTGRNGLKYTLEIVKMGKLFCIMGKSSSGKDTLYRMLMEDKELNLQRVVPYTTRPIRSGETEGKEYHFTTQQEFRRLENEGKVVEYRCYHTCHGDWYYYTVDDGEIDFSDKDYLIIGTLESYNKTKEYFGDSVVVPLYVDLDDGERLMRALSRERSQEEPKYKEMCRRFIADSEDFCEEKIAEAGITKRFYNEDLQQCLQEIREYMLQKEG